MKQPIWLGVAILLAWHAQAGDAPSSFLSGERNVYLHVVLEKANGEDIRARTIPQATIAKAEAD